MIPTIEDIVRMLAAGECTKAQAVAWLNAHRDLAAESAVPDGMVIAPAFRGYAHLGLGAGNYVLFDSAAGHPAELVICPATEDEKAGRTIGERRNNADDAAIPAERIAVRIRFESALGLDVLEDQLRTLREEHFPGTVPGAALPNHQGILNGSPAAQPEPKQTFTRKELIAAIEAERHACSMAVWMTKMDAVDPGADDRGVAGWLEEAEQRIKNRSAADPEVAQQAEPLKDDDQEHCAECLTPCDCSMSGRACATASLQPQPQLNRAAAPQQPAAQPVAFDLNAAVDRFLGWPLPQDFAPDGGITFDRKVRTAEGEKDRAEMRPAWWPVGTNLLTADQARAMLAHVLGLSAEQQPAAQPVADVRADGMPVSANERYLRRLLAAQVAVAGMYYDDGEATGAEHRIVFDFMREPVANLDAKIRALNVARLTLGVEQQAADEIWRDMKAQPAAPHDPDEVMRLAEDAQRWRFWRQHWQLLTRMEVARPAGIDLSRRGVYSPDEMDEVTDAALARAVGAKDE